MRIISSFGIGILMMHSLSAQFTREGVVETWGTNMFGQLGRTTIPTNLPDFAYQAYNFKQVSAGESHTLGLRSDGTVWAWGKNSDGQLGNATLQLSGVPVQVKDYSGAPLSGVSAVSAGGSFSLALKSDGSVYAWGRNAEGQLGVGTDTPRLLQATPALILNVTAISAGGSHSLALRADGNIYAWGSNARGQLGDGTVGGSSRFPHALWLYSSFSPTTFKAISAGAQHSLAIRTDGVVVSWGDNTYGQVGPQLLRAEIGSLCDHCNPAPSPVATSRDGSYYLSSASSISAGGVFSLAIVGQQVFGWGRNNLGQLARGYVSNSPNDEVFPAGTLLPTGAVEIAAGYNHALLRLPSGEVDSWGDNSNGQLGIYRPTNTFYSTSCLCATAAQVVSAPSTSLSIAAGLGHSAAVMAPRLAAVPGSLAFGAVAVGATSPTLSLEVKNYGPGPVDIASLTSRSGLTLIPAIAITGLNAADFRLQPPSFPSTLAEGASFTVSMYFQPQAAGAREAYLSVLNNGFGAAQAKLTGQAVK